MNPLTSNQPQTPNIGQLFQDFKKDPAAFLVKSKYNIPQNVGNDPQSIIQHLVSSGQISQQQINMAQNMMPQLRQMIGR